MRDELRRTLRGDGHDVMKMRRSTIEPVFGQIKEARGARRFPRRGLAAAQAEWKLLCATHNLIKLWRHHLAAS